MSKYTVILEKFENLLKTPPPSYSYKGQAREPYFFIKFDM